MYLISQILKNQRRFAENCYFKQAVCLNSKGEIQAQAMSEIIKLSKLLVGNIISSHSCRARQTNKLVFRKYDNLNKGFMFGGLFTESEGKEENFLKIIF